MMRRAGTIKPGDILARSRTMPRRTVYRIMPGPHSFTIELWAITLEWIDVPSPPLAPEIVNVDLNLDVEVEPDVLTPVQARADEIIDLLEQAVASDAVNNPNLVPAWRRAALLVLGDLRPKPPTLEEVLAALVNAEPKLTAMVGEHDRRIGPLLDLLDRARRSGVLS